MENRIKTETSRILVKEHEYILKLVDALNKECDLIEEGKKVNEKFFKKAIDFIRNYADKFHHAKEEDILFKEFVKKVESDEGCVHCNPVEQMLVEHNYGRKAVKMMEEGISEKDKKKVLRGARDYSNLIQEHIFKEDNILYPMADDILDENTEKEMLKKFNEIQKREEKNTKEYLNFIGGLK